MRRTTLALTTIALICLGATSAAQADETVKVRVIMHAISVQSQDIGDVDGHTVSIARYSGLASFPDGSIGTTYFTGVVDYIKGAGPIVFIYQNLTFSDGSVLWFKTSGTNTVEGTKSVYQGSGTLTSGTGRYAGAKGDLTVIGARIGPLATGADLYHDLVINIKK